MAESDKSKAADPHPDYPGLTYADVEKAQKAARARVEKERTAAAMKAIEEAEVGRLAREEGVSAEPIVQVELNLAPDMKEIVLDGKIFRNRTKPRVRVSVARDLLYAQFKGWENESRRLGEDKFAFYAQKAQETRAPLVINGRTGVIHGSMPTGTHG